MTSLRESQTLQREECHISLFRVSVPLSSVTVTDNLTIDDVDNTLLDTATLTIGNYVLGEDLLSFTDTGAITGAWNPSAGTLTLSGTDTVAVYQTALRSVGYSNTSDDPATDTRTIDIVVTDAGQVSSDIVQREIQINAVNDEPSGTDNTISLPEDASYVFSVTDFGFSDNLDNHGLSSLLISSVPDSGLLMLNNAPVFMGDKVTLADINSGQFVYISEPNVNGSGVAGFDFQVLDDGGIVNSGVDTDTTPNTISIDIESINDAPAGKDTVLSGLEDTNITFGLSDFGYSDTDANNFEAVIFDSVPAGGQLLLGGAAVDAGDVVNVTDIEAGNLVYQPDNNDHGIVADFEFRVRDNGGIVNGGINTSAVANAIQVDVAQVNDSPDSDDNVIAVTEDIQHTFSLTDFPFTDADGDQLAGIVVSSLPEHGILALSGSTVAVGSFVPADQIESGNFKFLPTSDTATSGFEFQVRDTGGVLNGGVNTCLLYTSPSPRDATLSRMPSSA